MDRRRCARIMEDNEANFSLQSNSVPFISIFLSFPARHSVTQCWSFDELSILLDNRDCFSWNILFFTVFYKISKGPKQTPFSIEHEVHVMRDRLAAGMQDPPLPQLLNRKLRWMSDAFFSNARGRPEGAHAGHVCFLSKGVDNGEWVGVGRERRCNGFLNPHPPSPTSNSNCS